MDFYKKLTDNVANNIFIDTLSRVIGRTRCGPWRTNYKSMAFAQKRAAPRIDAEFPGRMILGTGERKVVTKNINAYGAYLLTDRCPSVGDRIKLYLEWSFTFRQRETAFEVSGTVLRIDQLSEDACGFAVKFAELPTWPDL